MVRRGELSAREELHRNRTWLRVERASVDDYLKEHGKFTRKRPVPSHPGIRLADILKELEALTAAVEGLTAGAAVDLDRAKLERERDDLRALALAHQATIARLLSAGELQRAADRERSTALEHMKTAFDANERADKLRLSAYAEIEAIISVSASGVPGHPGDLDGHAGVLRRDKGA
jgi:hypothetical protein